MRYFFAYPFLPDLLFPLLVFVSGLTDSLFTYEDNHRENYMLVHKGGFSLEYLANKYCQQKRGKRNLIHIHYYANRCPRNLFSRKS